MELSQEVSCVDFVMCIYVHGFIEPMRVLILLANLCVRRPKKKTGTSICFKRVKRVKRVEREFVPSTSVFFKHVKRVERESLTIYSAKLVNELYACVRN